MRRAFRAFWGWYERHYLINLGLATGLFLLQVMHLAWLTTDVVAARLVGQSFFDPVGPHDIRSRARARNRPKFGRRLHATPVAGSLLRSAEPGTSAARGIVYFQLSRSGDAPILSP